MNYSEMSDFEINKAVLVALWGGKIQYENMGIAIFDMGNNPPVVVANPPQSGSDFAPCNSWAYAGPIIAANKISLDFDADGYEPARYAWCKASSPCGQVYYGGESQPLRAAMIVFLMMKEDSCAN